MSLRRTSPVAIPEPDRHSCTIGQRHSVLARVPFFAGLDADDIDRLNNRVGVRDYEAGDTVYRPGQPARVLYVVAVGTAKLTRRGPDGSEVLLGLAVPGDFLGALPVLGEETYEESATALTPMCLLTLDTVDFEAVMRHHPSVARAGLGVVAQRLRDAEARIRWLSAATAEQRVAATLLMLADRIGTPNSGGVLLGLPLSRDDLAGMTGSASETVSRVLARMRREGLIETGRQWVRIRDRSALAALAGAERAGS